MIHLSPRLEFFPAQCGGTCISSGSLVKVSPFVLRSSLRSNPPRSKDLHRRYWRALIDSQDALQQDLRRSDPHGTDPPPADWPARQVGFTQLRPRQVSQCQIRAAHHCICEIRLHFGIVRAPPIPCIHIPHQQFKMLVVRHVLVYFSVPWRLRAASVHGVRSLHRWSVHLESPLETVLGAAGPCRTAVAEASSEGKALPGNETRRSTRAKDLPYSAKVWIVFWFWRRSLRPERPFDSPFCLARVDRREVDSFHRAPLATGPFYGNAVSWPNLAGNREQSPKRGPTFV